MNKDTRKTTPIEGLTNLILHNFPARDAALSLLDLLQEWEQTTEALHIRESLQGRIIRCCEQWRHRLEGPAPPIFSGFTKTERFLGFSANGFEIFEVQSSARNQDEPWGDWSEPKTLRHFSKPNLLHVKKLLKQNIAFDEIVANVRGNG